jgi:hypothetical protein
MSRGRGVEVLARPIDVDLTVYESKALRMALAFGVPDPIPAEINSARDKLLAAERAAGHDV